VMGTNVSQSVQTGVLVAGGGLAGVAAAVCAARQGADVLLVEREGCLGGMATIGLVNPFMPYCVWVGTWKQDLSQPVNAGWFAELLAALDAEGGLEEGRQTFDEEILKLVLDRMCRKAGVRVLFHTLLTDVNREGDEIRSVTLYGKSGPMEVKARCFVDATGDADLTALAKCPVELGRSRDGKCQPMTLCFRISGIDMDRFDKDRDGEALNRLYKTFREQGLLRNPREDVLIFSHMAQGVLHFNSTRVLGKSATDAWALSEAEMEGREQVFELQRFLREHMPGFENSRVLMSAGHIGVRESRRIVGEVRVEAEDLLACRQYPDAIARGNYPMDIHNPDGTGTSLHEIPHGMWYTLPFRALVPKGMQNLLVAGKPISASHEAHSSTRVMPICTNVGEAAGYAAALCAARDLSLQQLPVEALQALIRQNGGLF
jgi:hypothetical protein